MQKTPEESDSSLDSCAQTRIDELTNQLNVLRRKRFHALNDKYIMERAKLKELGTKSEKLKESITKLCTQLLSRSLNPTCKSKAVVDAILRNTLLQKKVIDDSFDILKKRLSDAEYDFNKFLFVLSHIFYVSPVDKVTEAEDMLILLRKHVVLISCMESEILEKCFQFLCNLDRALQKIQIVLKKLKILNTVLAVVL